VKLCVIRSAVILRTPWPGLLMTPVGEAGGEQEVERGE